MSLLRNGGFVHAGAIPGDPAGMCAVCGTSLSLAWVHIASMQVVCGSCMPDPDANGAGERMADWLTKPPDDEAEAPDLPRVVGID